MQARCQLRHTQTMERAGTRTPDTRRIYLLTCGSDQLPSPRLAEGVGLEPTTPCGAAGFRSQFLVQPDAFRGGWRGIRTPEACAFRFSRPAPSTARPSIRIDWSAWPGS